MIESKADVDGHGIGLADGDMVGGTPVLEAFTCVLQGHANERAVVTTDTNGRDVNVFRSVFVCV